jgi:hypothetical protein
MSNTLTYSPVSAIDRKIVKAPEYDIFFGKTDNKRIVQKGDFSTRETVLRMIDIINTKSWQTKKIAKNLETETLVGTCRNIWDFCFRYIKYQKDIEEELREPNATWRDGQILARQYPNVIREDGVQYGVDCDCYSIFIGSILSNLDIPFNIKMTSYVNSLGLDNGFQHVYIIVPLIKDRYLTIDPVVNEFNYEKPVSKYELFTLQKKIHSTMAKVFVLSGVETQQNYANSMIDIITGRNLSTDLFGDTDDNSMLEYLKSTRKAVISNPEIITNQSPEDFVQMIDLAIKNWLVPEKRENALEQLSNLEEYLIQNKAILKGFEDEELSGFFKELKAKNQEKKIIKKEKKETKEKGTILNKLNKFNPATLAVRNAFRTVLAINFLGLSTILSSDDTKAKEVRTKVDNLYFSLGGKKDKLDKTIEKAKSKKPIFNKNATDKVEIENDDLGWLGVAGEVAAVVTAAAVPLAVVTKWVTDAGLMKKEVSVTTTSTNPVTTTLPADLNKDGQVSFIEKRKFKKEEKKADGKQTFFEKMKARIASKNTSTTDVSTTDTTKTDSPVEKTENQIEEFANSETPTNDETSLKNTLGKLIKEHPLGFAIGTTAVISSVALLFPQVREWVGISSDTTTKKLGIVSLS